MPNLSDVLRPLVFTISCLTTKNLLDIYSSGKFDITDKNSYIEMMSHINHDIHRKTNGRVAGIIFDKDYIDFTKRVLMSGLKHPDPFYGNTFIYTEDDRSKYVLYLLSMSSIVSLATFSMSGIAVLVTASMIM